MPRNRGASIGKTKRQRIIEAHEGRCAICGAKPDALTMDHKIPRVLGGSSLDSNLQPACPRCNRKKADQLPADHRHAPAIYATTDQFGAVL